MNKNQSGSPDWGQRKLSKNMSVSCCRFWGFRSTKLEIVFDFCNRLIKKICAPILYKHADFSLHTLFHKPPIPLVAIEGTGEPVGEGRCIERS